MSLDLAMAETKDMVRVLPNKGEKRNAQTKRQSEITMIDSSGPIKN